MLYTMERTNIYLTGPQKKALEKLAAKKDISVAELIRRIIDKELDQQREGS
jgi:predicted DNA-binding ribbon-helix-helix protein